MLEHSFGFGQEFTIATLNIQRMQNGSGPVVETLGQLREEDDASIIFLQEAKSKKGIDPVLQAVEEGLPGWPIAVFEAENVASDALITAIRPQSFTLGESSGILLPSPEDTLFQRTIAVVNGRVEGMGAQVSRVALLGDLTQIDLVNTHLSDTGGEEHRVVQASAIRKYLDTRPPADYTIIAGDMNTIGRRAKAKRQAMRIAHVLNPRNIDLTAGIERTHEVFRSVDDNWHDVVRGTARFLHDWKVEIGQKLDQIVGDVTPVRAAVRDVSWSDHSALIATFGLGMRQVEEE